MADSGVATRSKLRQPRPSVLQTVPRLQKPLSELDEVSQIPLFDIEEFVNRPIETRQADALNSKKCKTPRPMNAFILYRKAYTPRAAAFLLSNGRTSVDHQKVSALSGASWKMETAEVKKRFHELGDTERERHKEACIDWQYQP